MSSSRAASHNILERGRCNSNAWSAECPGTQPGKILNSSNVETVKLPARSPNLNAYAERFVRSIKSECLAQIIPLGERHLRAVVKEFTEHYHLERNHQGLENELIAKPRDELNMTGAVECRERLGGVLKYYYRGAA
jgi:putative transposase